MPCCLACDRFVYAFTRWIAGQRPYDGLAAAMALGAAILGRVESLLLLVPVGLYLIVLLRWTQGVAELEIPWKPAETSQMVTLEAGSPRPDTAPVARTI